MTQESGHKSWWITLPGILTQLAALVTALSGLVAVLYQTGVFRHSESIPAPNMAATPSTDAAAPSPISSRHNGAAPIASAPPPAPAPAPKGAIAIRIGDTISDGVPTPGAGKIESPGTEDVYQFSASPNQRVYFRMLEHGANMSQIKWRLTDQDDQEVFNTCLGCGEPGVQILTKGGTYILTVGYGQDPATGTYKLRLTNVPPANLFAIKPNSKISDGVPEPGAGSIETPGASDVYTFNVAPGQRVYFRMRDHAANMSQIHWQLTDQDDQEVFNTCLGCGEPGMKTLEKGGAYRMTLGNPKEPATGTYKLDLTTP